MPAILSEEMSKKFKQMIARVLLDGSNEKFLNTMQILIGKDNVEKMIEEIYKEYSWLLSMKYISLSPKVQEIIAQIYEKSRKFKVEIPFFIKTNGELTFCYSLKPHPSQIKVSDKVIEWAKKEKMILVHTHYTGNPPSHTDRIFHLRYLLPVGVLYENGKLTLVILKGYRNDIEVTISDYKLKK